MAGLGAGHRLERDVAVVDGEDGAADSVRWHELGNRGSDGLVHGRCAGGGDQRGARLPKPRSRVKARAFRVTESVSRVMVRRRVIAPATAITTPSPTVPGTASISRTTGGVATEMPSSAAQRPRHGRARGTAGSVSLTIDGCSAAAPQAR